MYYIGFYLLVDAKQPVVEPVTCLLTVAVPLQGREEGRRLIYPTPTTEEVTCRSVVY